MRREGVEAVADSGLSRTDNFKALIKGRGDGPTLT
jgi:hypothetical protein